MTIRSEAEDKEIVREPGKARIERPAELDPRTTNIRETTPPPP